MTTRRWAFGSTIMMLMILACDSGNHPTATRALHDLVGNSVATSGGSVGPLVELSQPNAVGGCNDGFNLFGTWPVEHAEEPFVTANANRPNNVVAAWIQGPFQDIIAASSGDGGQSWQRVPVPLTLCSGGPFLASADPWLSFGPSGDLHLIADVANTSVEIGYSRSGDGGSHWSPVVALSGNVDLPVDHPSITADPTDPRFVYAIWDGSTSGHRGPAVFTRSTDGGTTWETPRAVVQPDPHSFVQFSEILVLPNGTLVDLYEFYRQLPNKLANPNSVQLLRSTDRGLTWSLPITAAAMMPLESPSGNTLVIDPETGQLVQDPTNPSFAVDSRTGNLYAAWEDGRFSNFQYNDIAFSMSADGGATWSAPIRVNQTPLTIPAPNRQSFLPAIAVAADGTIGVSYYDFRFNTSEPGLPTDRWLVQCQPASGPATDPASWGNEVRLTSSSFNMEAVVPRFAGAFFIGDYAGLADVGNGFVAVFSQPDQAAITSIFSRSVKR